MVRINTLELKGYGYIKDCGGIFLLRSLLYISKYSHTHYSSNFTLAKQLNRNGVSTSYNFANLLTTFAAAAGRSIISP